MKKYLYFLLIPLCFITISVSIELASNYLNKVWSGLIVGIGLMLGFLVVYLCFKKYTITKYITILINCFAIGFSITSYYQFISYSLNIIDYLYAIIISSIVIAIYLLLKNKWYKFYDRVFSFIFIFLSFAISLALVLIVEEFNGLTFYFLNVSYFLMIGLKDGFSVDKLVLSTYGAFILVTIIVLIVISEGDIGDIGDLFGTKGKKKKKKLKLD